MSSTLEDKCGYTFKDRRLLDAALTHASMRGREGNNERLEFLGDRVLGLAMADMLYRQFKDETEGDLAKRHAALVQEKTLAAVAGAIDLPASLRLSAGERKAGGLAKDAIVADAMEALIGAVYLDGGFTAGQAVVEKLWRDMLHVQAAPPEDPKTALQEWVQARSLPLPVYRLLGREGADHTPVFDIELTVQGFDPVIARGTSKRAAEKLAAVQMMDRIREQKS